jgi:hypothetical protein
MPSGVEGEMFGHLSLFMFAESLVAFLMRFARMFKSQRSVRGVEVLRWLGF